MSGSVQISDFERRTLSKVKRYMFVYFILSALFYQLDRTNVGFAQLTMGKELGLKAATFGLAAGIFSFSAFLMQVPASYLLEKYRARTWITFNMIAWGLIEVAQAFVHSGMELVVLRFLLGIFEAGFLVGEYVLVSIWFRGKDQGVMYAFIQMAVGLSAIVGSPFGGWVLGKQFFGIVGWRNLFLIEGALPIIWGILALRILNDDPAKASWLKPEERDFMVKHLSEYQADKGRRGAIVTADIWSVFKDLRILQLMFCFGVSGWTAATFQFFTPTLLKRAGTSVSIQYVGFLAAGPYAVMAVATYLWGRHSDKHNERHYHSVLAVLVAAVGILLYPIATGPLVAMLCLCLVQIGNGSFLPMLWASCNLVVGKEAMAKATALIWASNLLWAFLAPVYFGWGMDRTGHITLGMYTAVGLMLLSFVIMNVFFFRYKAQQKAQAAPTVAAS